MTPRLPRTECGPVLAGVKAKPFGWPAASLDPDCGRGPNAASGSPAARTKQKQVSTVSGDCHKTHAGWQYDRAENGTITWTTPTGHKYIYKSPPLPGHEHHPQVEPEPGFSSQPAPAPEPDRTSEADDPPPF